MKRQLRLIEGTGTAQPMRVLQWIFISGGRPRAGWRLLVYGLMLAICVAGLGAAIRAIGFPSGWPGWIADLWASAGYLAGVFLATWLTRRFVDQRPLLDLGLRRAPGWWLELLFGVALGGVLMLGIFAVDLSLGWVRVLAVAWQENSPSGMTEVLLFAIWGYAVVAANEELIVRGYLLQNLAAGLSLKWAVFLSSAIFGLLHLGNPGASWISTLNVAVAGLLLALGYVVTRGLWLPIGLHFSWNLFQGPVFGFPVSGHVGRTLIKSAEVGPDLVTGGGFGPEAGLTGLAAMLLGMAAIVLWARWEMRLPRHRSPT